MSKLSDKTKKKAKENSQFLKIVLEGELLVGYLMLTINATVL